MPACVDCEIGYHAAVEGMAHCAICSPGTVQPATAGTECIDCDVGTYYPTFGGDVCAASADGAERSGPAYLRLTFVLPEGEYDEAIRRLRAMLLSPRCGRTSSAPIASTGLRLTLAPATTPPR